MSNVSSEKNLGEQLRLTKGLSNDESPVESSEAQESIIPLKECEYSLYLKEYRILIEYKHLPRFVPSGVYVVPSSDSIFCEYRPIYLHFM